ncbi:MAG: glycosyltransferase [Candidatus Doudnabacteria bacterium]|nr:glycosyltransferase [Candidatus Doudnabacteria bacterium]
MKILFISAANSIHTVRWVNALASRGIDVHLVYLANHMPEEDDIDKRVTLHELPISGHKGYYLNAFRLRKIHKMISPDAINCHFASGYGTLSRLAKMENVVLTVLGSDIFTFPKISYIHKRIVQRNLRSARIITSSSYCMAEEVKKILRQNQKYDIRVVPFGVSLSKFMHRTYNANSSNKIVVTNIKTLKPIYGIDTMVRVIEQYRNLCIKQNDLDAFKRLQVNIYGKGPDKEKIQLLIDSLGLTKKVHLRGYIPNKDVPRVLSKTDIFLVTSLNESFGVSVIEAMAAKIPVIASDALGFTEIISNTSLGVIVNKYDPASFALSLYKLVKDPTARKALASNAYAEVERKYNWEQNVDIMLQAYRDASKN